MGPANEEAVALDEQAMSQHRRQARRCSMFAAGGSGWVVDRCLDFLLESQGAREGEEKQGAEIDEQEALQQLLGPGAEKHLSSLGSVQDGLLFRVHASLTKVRAVLESLQAAGCWRDVDEECVGVHEVAALLLSQLQARPLLPPALYQSYVQCCSSSQGVPMPPPQGRGEEEEEEEEEGEENGEGPVGMGLLTVNVEALQRLIAAMPSVDRLRLARLLTLARVLVAKHMAGHRDGQGEGEEGQGEEEDEEEGLDRELASILGPYIARPHNTPFLSITHAQDVCELEALCLSLLSHLPFLLQPPSSHPTAVSGPSPSPLRVRPCATVSPSPPVTPVSLRILPSLSLAPTTPTAAAACSAAASPAAPLTNNNNNSNIPCSPRPPLSSSLRSALSSLLTRTVHSCLFPKPAPSPPPRSHTRAFTHPLTHPHPSPSSPPPLSTRPLPTSSWLPLPSPSSSSSHSPLPFPLGACQRRRMVWACRALREQIEGFEASFVLAHHTRPRGSQRAVLGSTYALYRDWKRLIRDDAAAAIQRLYRAHARRRAEAEETEAESVGMIIGGPTKAETPTGLEREAGLLRGHTRRAAAALREGGLRGLLEQKREIKAQLKAYDAHFHAKHGRLPSKSEKEPIRQLYLLYNTIKDTIRTVHSENNAPRRHQRSHTSPTDRGSESRRASLLTPTITPGLNKGKTPPLDNVTPAPSSRPPSHRPPPPHPSPLSHNHPPAHPQPSSPSKLADKSSSHSSNTNNQGSGNGGGNGSPVGPSSELWALKAAKRRLHERLRTFERDFERKHGRRVSTALDIAPVEADYRDYKRLKARIHSLLTHAHK